MLTAAAICPHPPVLVPEATGGKTGQGDAELTRLRQACDGAVATIVRTHPDVLVLVGSADRTELHPSDAPAALTDYGIPFTSGSAGAPVLPLSLTIGRWLLARADASVPYRLRLQAVAAATSPEDCLILGASIAELAPRVAVLAMGDGPARRARGAPRALDADADRYDKQLSAALAAADAGYLADLDPAQDEDLFIAGRTAWQVLAGAALADADTDPRDSDFTADLRYAAAPFEVSYFVATWTLAR